MRTAIMAKRSKPGALVAQAKELAISTPYSYESIRRLQRGLMNPDPHEDGDPLTESEVLAAVPSALQVDLVSGRGAGVGRALRLIKAMGAREKAGPVRA